MDLIKLISNPNEYFNMEKENCENLRIILTASEKLLNKLSYEQQQMIYNQHQKLSDLLPVNNTRELRKLNCSDQEIIFKVIFRFKNILEYYEQGKKHVAKPAPHNQNLVINMVNKKNGELLIPLILILVNAWN